MHVCAHAHQEDHMCNYTVCANFRGGVPRGKVKLDSLDLNTKSHHDSHHLKVEHTPWWCDIKQGKFFSFEWVCHPYVCVECQRLFVMQKCGSNGVQMPAITADVLKIFKSIELYTAKDGFEQYELLYGAGQSNISM